MVAAQFAVGLQGVALAVLSVTWTRAPAGSDVFALLWLREQRPVIVLTGLSLGGAAALTVVAWPVRGAVRGWLVVSWLVTLGVLVGVFGDRLWAWGRLLWVVYG